MLARTLHSRALKNNLKRFNLLRIYSTFVFRSGRISLKKRQPARKSAKLEFAMAGSA